MKYGEAFRRFLEIKRTDGPTFFLTESSPQKDYPLELITEALNHPPIIYLFVNQGHSDITVRIELDRSHLKSSSMTEEDRQTLSGPELLIPCDVTSFLSD